MGLPIVILIVAVVGLIVGGTFVLGAPIFAVPILLLLPGPFVMLGAARNQARQRRIKNFRRSAKAKKTDFRPADRETIV